MTEERKEFEEGEGAPKFNMALDILKSAEETMRLIRANDLNLQGYPSLRLGNKISLIKSYFEIISPLLDEVALKYDYIHDIQLPSKPKVRGGMRLGEEFFYDNRLDQNLGRLLVKLRLELQKKGFCMPPQDEGGLF